MTLASPPTGTGTATTAAPAAAPATPRPRPDVDPDAVTAAVLQCPGVAAMAGGTLADVATYLPGRIVKGVRTTDDQVEVHVVARWDVVIPTMVDDVRAAVTAVAGGRAVAVHVDDVDSPA